MAVRTLEYYGYDVLEASDPYKAVSVFETIGKTVHIIRSLVMALFLLRIVK